jgi:predicted ATP-dependent endonuclease of OLD family
MDTITIKDINLKQFRNFGLTNIKFDESETILVGGNGTGKSTIINSISWVFCNTDIWGKSMSVIQNGGLLAYASAEFDSDEGFQTIRRTNSIGKSGGIKTLFTGKALDIDRDLFLAISNPRYFISLSPMDIKRLLVKIVVETTKTVEYTIDKAIVEYVNNTIDPAIFTNDQLAQVDNLIKAEKGNIKTLTEEMLKAKGSLDAYNLLKDEIIKTDTEDIALKINDLIETETDIINTCTREIDEKKESIKIFEMYRQCVFSSLANIFNSHLKDIRIVINEDGKDVFDVFYKDTDIKSISNAEQLLAGLEICDTICGLTGKSYPLLVDNAEAILNINMGNYPNIKQAIFAIVADNPLSIWENGVLTDIVTLVAMRRSRDSLRPKTHILDGWGT